MAAMLAVGLMSGTSMDGVTAVLVRFSGRRARVLRLRTYPFAPALRARVLGAARLTTPELSRLNFELGEAFARAAAAISRGAKPSVVGSHGQTVWHGPAASPANTLQLGEPAVIAERVALPVVADFRPRDVAAGGQGAPLVPAFDEFLFSRGPVRALQNIGGIGNVSIVGGGRLWTAFDTGPGNGLLDLACRLATAGRLSMDEDGRLAARGTPDLRALDRMLRDPYFSRRPPKSLDKDDFGEAFLRRHLGRPTRARLPGVLATLTMLTARSIAQSYARFSPKRVEQVAVSGGGALNPTLMRELAALMAPVPVVKTDVLGLPAMAKEAACFAWLAARALEGKTNNCPQATGARGRRVLGKLVPA